MTIAGDRILKSVEQALAFAKGEKDHGCAVHIPEQVEDIDYSDIPALDIRRDQQKTSELQAIQAALIEGERGGMIERTPDEIMKAVLERRRG